MTRKALSAITVAMAVSWSMAALAQSIPQTFTFTARVSNADGPLTGTHQIILRMYDARTAGTKLWEESHIDVPVTDGLVTMAMGSETAISNADLTDAGVWVEVVVDGSTLAPRIQLRGVPYARRSQDALTLRGKAPSAFLASTGGTLAGNLDISPGDLSLYGKLAVRGDDAWLRLNQTGAFTNGVYTPGLLRVDGDIQLSGRHAFRGNDSWLRLNQDGAFTSGTHSPLNFNASGITVGGLYYDPGAGNLEVQNTIMTSGRTTDCPVGYSCNAYFWDISAATTYSYFYDRSDRRLKKEIKPVPLGLDAVLKLRPVSFEWKDARQPGIHYGFISQEIEQVMPAVVRTTTKGYKTFESMSVLSVTVKAVQELKAENDKLHADIDQLRQEVEALKAGHPLPPRGSKTAALHWVGPLSLGGGVLVFAVGLVATFGRRRRKGDA